MTTLHQLLKTAEAQPLVQVTFALNGIQEELGMLAALLTVSHLEIKGHYNLKKALEMTRDGKPASVTLLLKVLDSAKFAKDVTNFDGTFFTYLDNPRVTERYTVGTVYTQDGPRLFIKDRLTQGFKCQAQISPAFIEAI